MKALALTVLLLTLLSNAPATTTLPPLREFVTVQGDRLLEGDKPFRFISWNIPNLLIVEDNVPFAETNPWRLPDRFELTDALATVRQMGGTVVRTYVVTVRRTNDPPGTPRHVLGPGQFNEEAFRAFDLALQVANEQGIRLIIPLVDNWSWQGGRAEYAGFRGKNPDEFWTDPQLIEDFKRTIHVILTRTNTLTGTRYADDKAILCWETGNELTSPASWTREIGAYIKSIDPNHPVMDGYHTTELRAESLEMPEVDIVTTHHYPGPKKSFAELIRENWQRARGKKPYLVGEFGFVDTTKIEQAIDAIQATGTAGGLLWSLRFRNRDGGFYWHSEPYGGDQYKAFHWPGSTMGDAYDEVGLMAMVRRKAFEIRDLPEPPLPKPAPPTLLPISGVNAISWQGSVGATGYTVERSGQASGPWTEVGEDVDETFVQYRPLFADETAPAGNWFYRVRAVNKAGVSEPSNAVGPVKVAHAVFVDELSNWKRVAAHSGDWEIRTRDCRRTKEDAHRAAGGTGDWLVYRLATSIEGFRVFAFFPSELTDLKFAVSTDGKIFEEVNARRAVFFEGTGDYGYWIPARYDGRLSDAEARYLKIELTGETQIGRVEITHALER